MPAQIADHVPVLANAVVDAFASPGILTLVDGTVGLGGHAERLLAAYPSLVIWGLDWDKKALEPARRRLAPFGERFRAVEASYADLTELLPQWGLRTVDGILLDLGLSSLQLADTERGFSFLRPGPLDMRMSETLQRTAWDFLNGLDEEGLSDLFQSYGEEPQARRIACRLKDRLRQGTLSNDAWEIAQVIRGAVSRPERIDPATRCFQALRIAVNHELDNLEKLLESLKGLLAPGGRAAVISYHSLEDRRVKTVFRRAASSCVCPPRSPECRCGHQAWGKLITRKAIQPDAQEMQSNPRARSGRLRVLEKL
jgi:16S rRNA (cytosine1402-N4)-methyltransferase